MRSLISVELLKIRRRRVTWVSFGIVVAFFAFMIIGLRLIIRGAEGPGSEAFREIDSALRFALGFGAIPRLEVQFGLWSVIVLVALLVGSEYGWGTLRLALARGPSRTQFMLGMLIAMMITVVIGTVAILIVGAIFMVVADLALGTFDPAYPDGFLSGLVLDWLRTAGVLMIYVGIAFAAAGLLRSGGAGLGVGIAFVVLEQIVGQIFSGFGGTLADISRFLPAALVQSVLSTNQLGAGVFGDDSGLALLETWTAGAVLIAYFVVLVGGTIWVFNRRDITGGGQ